MRNEVVIKSNIWAIKLSQLLLFESYRAETVTASNRWHRNITCHIPAAADAERYTPRRKHGRFPLTADRPRQHFTAWSRRHINDATCRSLTISLPVAPVSETSPDVDGDSERNRVYISATRCIQRQRRAAVDTPPYLPPPPPLPGRRSYCSAHVYGRREMWRHRTNQYITTRTRGRSKKSRYRLTDKRNLSTVRVHNRASKTTPLTFRQIVSW